MQKYFEQLFMIYAACYFKKSMAKYMCTLKPDTLPPRTHSTNATP